MGDDEPFAFRYDIITSDQFEIDRERTLLWLMRQIGQAYAAAWDAGLDIALKELSRFPGPLANALDERASRIFGLETRRLLYYGVGTHQSKTPYRILYTVIQDNDGESSIRILRILHGAQQLETNEDKDNE